MKIALIVPSFPKLSETFIVNKFVGLTDHRHEVFVICNQSKSTEWKYFPSLKSGLRSQIRLNWVRQPRWLIILLWFPLFLKTLLIAPNSTWKYFNKGWRFFGLGIFRYFYLDANLIVVNPDIIHIEFGALASNRMYVKELLDCKIIVSFRGYDINYVGLEQPNYYAEVWEKADGLHFLGYDLWLRAQRRGCPPDKIHALIPPAIDTTFFKSQRTTPSGQENETLKIVSVGRLEWKKGYEYALLAIRKLLSEGYFVKYRIIGDGDYLEPLAFCRYQFELGDSVELLGAIPHKDLVQHLEWADVFLHSAVSEGFSNAVIEAQAMELPIITSDADGLVENIEHGITGFVVPRRNPQALAERLIELAENSELRFKMGQAGRERVLSKFVLADQMLAFKDFYQHIIERY